MLKNLERISKEEKFKMILVSVTTIFGDWRAKIKEIKELGLKEIAIFPTCLNAVQRKELYKLLEDSPVEKIPFVHLKDEMVPDEIDYLTERFHTEVFNMHTVREFPILRDYSKYKKSIYIENVYLPLDENEVKEFGGICLDFSHLTNDKYLDPERFRKNTKVLEKFTIGCNHISAVYQAPQIEKRSGYLRYDNHLFKDLSDFDYLRQYPKNYFSEFLALVNTTPLLA